MTGSVAKVKTGKLLVIAPSRRSRGGISSVVDCLFASEVLRTRQIYWLETMDDRNTASKILSFLSALLRFPFLLISASLVHVHASSGTSFFRKSLFIVATALVGKRLIIHIHPAHFIDFVARQGLLGRWYVPAVLNCADAVFVLSDEIASRLQQHVAISRLHVLPNPCTFPVLAEKAWNPRRPHILFAGKIMAAKGCYELIHAFARVHRQFPAAKLIMAGNGEVAHFQKLASDMGLKEQVHFPGWLTGNDLLGAYHDAAIFCLPSHSEGLPMSLLEAMSQGAAIVATPVGGIPEVVHHNKNGLLVPVGDHEALASALIRLLENEAATYQLAKQAIATIRNGYEREAIGRKLANIYHDVENYRCQL